MINSFYKRIREVRLDNNLSQLQLAALCNVQQSCVSKWERGSTLPDAETLCVICKKLNVTADYLLGLSDI